MRVIVAVLSGLMVGIAAASTDQAFQAGKTLGAGSRQQAASQISAGSATGKVPSYGASAPETNYFQGGRGELSGHGITKMQTCATATPDSDPIKRQECEAVNFLARNPNTRPQFDLSNNPMFARAKNIRNNAENIFASLGMGGTGSTTQCVPRTITTPAQYSTDTCSSIREVGEQQCTMGRVIKIDADSNFQCDQTINAYETLKCRRTYEVSCTGGGTGCAPSGINTGTATISGFGRILLHQAGNNYWYLSAGTIAPDGSWINNYMFSDTFLQIFQSDIYFDITNKDNIATFFLDQILYDDNIAVWLNGNLIYHSTGGNDFNYCTVTEDGITYQDITDGGTCSSSFFEGGSNIYSYGGVELKHLLVNGTNHVRLKLVVGKNGDGIVRFKTLAYCPLNCSAILRNGCAGLEARAR